MALLVKNGYGQVEPNHLSAQRNGQIYAQLPTDASISELHNGQFVKYDYAAGKCNYNGNGEYMLVFNEVKLYDPRHSNKDFVYRRTDFTDKEMYPRVFKTSPGDIFTTNMVELDSKEAGTIAAGDKLQVDESTGILKYTASAEEGKMTWIVAKVYTLADGQPAVKIQRIA